MSCHPELRVGKARDPELRGGEAGGHWESDRNVLNKHPETSADGREIFVSAWRLSALHLHVGW
jgi:hypothetical protein